MNELSYKPGDIAGLFDDLRLPGISRVFEERYTKSIDQEMGTMEFLGSLLEEEALARKQRRFERLIKVGNLDMSDCIENYDFDLARSHGVDPSSIRDLIGCEYIQKSRNIVLAGSVGTGKTRLARALGFEAVRREYRVAFEYTRELIEKLYKLRDSHTFDRVYRYYVNVSVIILDDLAYMPFAPEKVDYLFRLIFDRSEKKTGPVIVTTNTDVKEWWSFFPSKAMGMTFSDRVLGGAIGLRFTGKSIRRAPRKQKEKK